MTTTTNKTHTIKSHGWMNEDGTTGGYWKCSCGAHSHASSAEAAAAKGAAHVAKATAR